jgi:hypothetical protein
MAEQKVITQARVVMGGDESFIDTCAGRIYELFPGEPTIIPVEAAYLWFGYPGIYSEDKKTARNERNRCRARRGGIYPLVESIELVDDEALRRKLKERGKKKSKASGKVPPPEPGDEEPAPKPVFVEEGEDEEEEEFKELKITKTAKRETR